YQGETIKREYPEFQFVLRKKSKNESDLTTKNINFVNDYIVDYNYNGGDTCLTKEKHVAESFLNPISSKFGFDRGKPIDRYYIENILNENKHFIRGRSPKSISISASQSIDFGNLRRLSPVSRVFGSDRMSDKSLPLCWYYIRQFLSKHAGDIKGRVLEMGDNTYTKMFGADHVTKSDVLHVTTGNSSATIIADLTKADNIPENTFDCIICTQTLQCIYDVRTAVQTLHRILKPGGVLLTSASGISQISRYDMDRWGEYWRFTTASFQKMFEEYWPKESIDVQSYGNVLVAISYLQGFVSGDLSEDEMAYHDDDYQMMLVARAVKPVNVEKNIDSFTSIAQETETDNKTVHSHYSPEDENDNVVQIITNGWDEYARNWTSDKFKVVPEHEVKNIGDEWTFEDNNAGITYGLPADIIDNFKEYINTKLLDVYLPSFSDEGLEIGPGGGRFTELLIPKTKILHLADSSDTMLQQLKQRFESEENLRFYHTDGMTLPALKEESLDYIIAIDVFVHFEPRLIYWYLRQMENLLKAGGTCIIHYANALTEIGWKQFETDLDKNVEGRKHFASFGTMCPQMMEKFLKSLGFEIIFTDLDIIPRDAIAIFRKPDKAIKLKNIQNPNSTGVGKRINTKKSFDDPIVLLYHRVAVDPIDSQLLAVLPENFEAHLKELAENYTVLPLHQLLEEAGKGQLQPDTLAITFDDGYLDNLTNAVPLLEKYGLHATIFVVSGMVGSQSEFWWDALERIFLTGHPLPGLLSIQDSQGILEWDLTTARDRLKAYDELCEMLRVLSSAKIDEIVNQLLIWAGLAHTGRTTHRVVDAQQLKLLASSASVEIGSHSITHTRLSSLSPQQQQYEIRESKQQLESIIKKPVRLFSYPYGGLEDITKETGRILAGAGYDTGIANVQGSLVSPVDMYAVPRRLVRNWSGPMFAQWLRDEDKASLEAQTLSDRAQRIINSSLLPWSKQKQTIQPQNKAGLNNCFPVAPLGVLL
ncbi:polysaccharide deacetylase family protein, partial [bacterium]|nr:polysaccharide deacetylase family protein [bacterium]